MPKYSNYISPTRADELYEQILRLLIVGKKYREKTFTALQLAHELNTNTRYVALVLSTRFHSNYSSLINRLRISDAMSMLVDARYSDMNVEEIANMVGYSNRQSFYTAFVKITGTTPRAYRSAHLKI